MSSSPGILAGPERGRAGGSLCCRGGDGYETEEKGEEEAEEEAEDQAEEEEEEEEEEQE